MLNLNLFPLTNLQKNVLIATAKFIRTMRYSPTYNEITYTITDISTPNLRHVVNALVEKGYLIKEYGKHRSISLANKIATLSTRQIKRLPSLNK